MGGSLKLNKEGQGIDHMTVYGDGAHFSYNINRATGEVTDVHGTLQKPERRW
jgi:hypothetical protein